MGTKVKIMHHWQLEVFQLAREGAQKFFQWSKRFPKEETYSLTDQGRRASRAVGATIAETWRRRKYEAAFVNKLNEAEGEATETHPRQAGQYGKSPRSLVAQENFKGMKPSRRKPKVSRCESEQVRINSRADGFPSHFPTFPPAHFRI